MGMFDTVVVDGLKLDQPKEIAAYIKAAGKSITNDFQTKDLDNCLGTYRIDSKGQLFRAEYVPTGKKIAWQSPLSRWTDKRSYLERLYYKLKEYQIDKKTRPRDRMVDERVEKFTKSKITTTFNMYNYCEVDGRYVELEYDVTVVNGKVTDVELVKGELESVSKSKMRHKENDRFNLRMSATFAARKKLEAAWYYPLLKELYNPLVFFSRIAIQAACNAIIKSTYNWRGV
jgi:hypothetical protein